MDVGGQAYHEKILKSFMLLDDADNIGAIYANFYCGMMNAYKVALTIRDAYKG